MAPLSSCIISGYFPFSTGLAIPIRNTTLPTSLPSIPPAPRPLLTSLFTSTRRWWTPSTKRALWSSSSQRPPFFLARISYRIPSIAHPFHCAPFDTSVEALPGDLAHTAFVAGTVSVVDDSVPARRSFTLAVSEHVRNERHAFHVRFVFDTTFSFFSTCHLNSSFRLDGTSNPWKNTPLPSVGSTVIATGTFEVLSRGTP